MFVVITTQFVEDKIMAAWWDKEHRLALVTPIEFAALPDGEVLTCINDTTAIKGVDSINGDTRKGYIAYGVIGVHPLRVALLEATLRKRETASTLDIPEHTAWCCTIGVIGDVKLPPGADAPMRAAIDRAFYKATGLHATFNFSGWGAELTDEEYSVIAKQQLNVK